MSSHSFVSSTSPDIDRPFVLRAQAGDADAFGELITRHHARIFGFLQRYLRNSDDAQDALQDTFAKAFEKIGSFEYRSKFCTWLMRIAFNTAVQQFRDRRRQEPLDDLLADQTEAKSLGRRRCETPEQLYHRAQTERSIGREVKRLPAKYRAVIFLKDMSELSTEETAAALGLGVPAAKARLFRARSMLRKKFVAHGVS